MSDEQIKEIARKYAEWLYPPKSYSDDFIRVTAANDMVCKLEWLLRDYCVVSREVFDKLDIAYRAKGYSTVALSKEDVERLPYLQME